MIIRCVIHGPSVDSLARHRIPTYNEVSRFPWLCKWDKRYLHRSQTVWPEMAKLWNFDKYYKIFAKVGSKFCPTLIIPSNNCLRVFKFCLSGEILPNLVTLVIPTSSGFATRFSVLNHFSMEPSKASAPSTSIPATTTSTTAATSRAATTLWTLYPAHTRGHIRWILVHWVQCDQIWKIFAPLIKLKCIWPFA